MRKRFVRYSIFDCRSSGATRDLRNKQSLRSLENQSHQKCLGREERVAYIACSRGASYPFSTCGVDHISN